MDIIYFSKYLLINEWFLVRTDNWKFEKYRHPVTIYIRFNCDYFSVWTKEIVPYSEEPGIHSGGISVYPYSEWNKCYNNIQSVNLHGLNIKMNSSKKNKKTNINLFHQNYQWQKSFNFLCQIPIPPPAQNWHQHYWYLISKHDTNFCYTNLFIFVKDLFSQFIFKLK